MMGLSGKLTKGLIALAVIVCATAAIAGFPGSGRKYPQGNGCPTGTTVVYLTSADTSPWTVPSCWNNSNNTVEVIGAGGGSGGTTSFKVGGGGAYSKTTNVSISGSAAFKVGLGVPAANGGDSWFCSSTSNCASISGTAVVVGAKGGQFGGPGGAASSGIGSTKYSGGTGSDGGGGAAGPNGDGGAGGSLSNVLWYGNGGGGGNGGGSAGVNGTSSSSAASGGAGGNNSGGSGGGQGATSSLSCSDGSNGGGGGGGSAAPSGACKQGCNGANGIEWDATHGSGGGGGGGYTDSSVGGNPGLYGGGAGHREQCSSPFNIRSIAGANGIIRITYTN